MNEAAPLLIVIGGLPGVGKTTLARGASRRLGAVHVRIDTIEQAMRDGVIGRPIDGVGYYVARAVAADNLRLGRSVVADCVNPWALTRDAWRETAGLAGARCVEVEVICSDEREHRRRVQTRVSDIEGLVLPNWEAVIARDYHAWDRERVVIDTATSTVASSIDELLERIR